MQRRRELIGGTIFFIFAAVYFVMALQIPEFNDGFVSSDAMPKIYGILLMLLSAAQIFGALRKKKDASEKGEEAGSGKIVIVPEVLITFFFLISRILCGLSILIRFRISGSCHTLRLCMTNMFRRKMHSAKAR